MGQQVRVSALDNKQFFANKIGDTVSSKQFTSEQQGPYKYDETALLRLHF
jgi:hypothetical protein